MKAPFPWQEAQWRSLIERFAAGRLPHALLFSGPAGLGKGLFAQALAQAWLCQQPLEDGRACGVCEGCHLWQVGNHPDVRLIEPEESHKPVVVDQIRGLVEYLSLKPHYAPRKVAIIQPAEQMNVAAANSLLKSLEEPPSQSMILLVSHRPGRLLATIRSRCQGVLFKTPPAVQAMAWLAEQGGADQDWAAALQLAAGAPLTALEIAGGDVLAQRQALWDDLTALAAGQTDAVGIAEKWLKAGVEAPLHWMTGWVADAVRLAQADDPPYRVTAETPEALRRLMGGAEPAALHWLLARLQEAERLSTTPLNAQLLLEEALGQWQRVASGWQPGPLERMAMMQ